MLLRCIILLFLQRGEARHARELRGATSANVFTVPELRTRLDGGYARLLSERAAKGGVDVSPGFHRSLLALTDVGFVDYNHTSIVKHTTISTEDYESLLSEAVFSCRPAVEGTRPEVSDKLDSEAVSRTEVFMDIEFPLGSVGSPGLAHFESRLEADGAFIVFDLHLLADHTSFAPGSICAEQIPFAATSYSLSPLSKAKTAPGGLRVSLLLKPVAITSVHHYMDVRKKPPLSPSLSPIPIPLTPPFPSFPRAPLPHFFPF